MLPPVNALILTSYPVEISELAVQPDKTVNKMLAPSPDPKNLVAVLSTAPSTPVFTVLPMLIVKHSVSKLLVRTPSPMDCVLLLC